MAVRSYAARKQECLILGNRTGSWFVLAECTSICIYSTGPRQSFPVYVKSTMKDVFPGQSHKGGRPTITHILVVINVERVPKKEYCQ